MEVMGETTAGRAKDAASRRWFYGVDVGGTNTKLGVIDNSGRVLARTAIATDEPRGPRDAMARIADALPGLLAEAGDASGDRVVAVGLATPGTMDIPAGKILEPPNMPHWRDFNVRDELARRLGVPVAFLNDGNAAAYGEFWIGTGRDYRSMIMLTLGTGVGGGIIVDGRLIHGSHSFGSECGHMVVDCRDDARTCVWGGGAGELEAFASASAVVSRTQDRLSSGRSSSLAARAETLTAKDVYEAAAGGDELALEIIDETAVYLGVAITTLVHLIDPGLVVLGGAMDFGGAGDPIGRRFIEGIRSEFRKRAFHVVRETTVIDFAVLGSDAGFIGAAGYARATLDAATS